MATLVLDTFAGSNGTDLSAHTPDVDIVGGGWLDSGANTVELDGAGAVKFSAINTACWIDVGASDQIVTTSFNNGGTDNRCGVLLRSSIGDPISGTNYYFNFKPDDTVNTVQILKRISGTQTLLAGANLSLTNGVTYDLECSVIGNQLIFKVDGATELSITDTSITSGDYVSLQHARWTNGNARFYDFQVNDGTLGGQGFTLLGSIEAPTLTVSASDVPLLVKPNTEFTAAMLLNLDVGGGDLRFSSDAAGLNQLPCEVVDGLDVVWVKPTGVSISTSATLYVWGDNAGASQPAVGDPFGRNAVWSDFEYASHDGLTDVTGNHTPTQSGTTLVAGPFGNTGGGREYNSSGVDYVYCSLGFTLNEPFTLSAWSRVDNTSAARIISAGDASATTEQANVFTNFGGGDAVGTNSISSATSGSAVAAGVAGDKTTGVWRSYSAVFTSDSLRKAILNGGTATATDTTSVSVSGMDRVALGVSADSTPFGIQPLQIAEPRLHLAAVSDNQISIEYDNQSELGSWWIASDVAGGTTGTITQNAAAFTQSLAGNTVAPPTTGTINQSATAFTQSALGSVTQLGITGVITQAISAFTQSLAGDVVSSGVNGSITQTTGSFTQALLGNTVLNVTGTVTQSASAFTQSLIGTTAEQISGIITQSVSSFTQSIVGEVPAQWIDKPRAVTIWGDNTPIFTLWTDR